MTVQNSELPTTELRLKWGLLASTNIACKQVLCVLHEREFGAFQPY